MVTTPLPPINPLPILIKSSENTPMHGFGAVFTKRGTEYTGLHVVTKKEAVSGAGWEALGTKERQVVRGLARLQSVLREKDWMEFQAALDAVEQYVPQAFNSGIAAIRNSKNWKRAGFAYSGLINNLLQSVQVVIWCSDKDPHLRPGLFCPDWEVAVYASVAMDHQRTCKKPGCTERFVRTGKLHEYCSSECQNAHAQARWKAAHPEEAKEQARRAREKARQTKKTRKLLR